MPLPLVHIVPISRRCGATTLTQLWGASADERPLQSPLPASGSPWVVPVVVASPQYVDHAFRQLHMLRANPHIRIGGVLITPVAPGPLPTTIQQAVEAIRKVVAPAPVHYVPWQRSLSTTNRKKVRGWDFTRPKKTRSGRWGEIYSQFASIVDYIAAVERSAPSPATGQVPGEYPARTGQVPAEEGSDPVQSHLGPPKTW